MACVDYQNRLDNIRSLIQAYEEVLAKIAANPQRSYTINTGQTTETVSKKDDKAIMDLLERLYAQEEFWCGRLSGTGGVVYVRPHF